MPLSIITSQYKIGKSKFIYLVRYIRQFNWSENLYLIAVKNKSILWKKNISYYGASVLRAKFIKQEGKKILIYYVGTTHQGYPNLRLLELETKDNFLKVPKFIIKKDLIPNSRSDLKEIKKMIKILDKKFKITNFKKL